MFSFLLLINFIGLVSGLLRINNKTVGFFYWSTLVSPAVVLRTGFDTEQYIELYDSIPRYLSWEQVYSWVWHSSYEPAFVALMAVLGKYDFDSWSLFLCMTGVSIALVIFVLSKRNYLFIPSLFVFTSTYYLWNEHVQIRQGLASALTFYGLYLLSETKANKYSVSLFFLGSSFFHRVGVLAFLAFLCNKIRFSREFWVLTSLLCVVSGLLNITHYLLFWFDGIGLLHWKISAYLHSDIFNQELSIYSFRVLKSMILACCIFCFWYTIKKDNFLFVLSVFYIIGVCFQFLLLHNYILSIRVSQFFMFVEILLVPYFLWLFNRRYFQVACFFVSVLFLLNFYFI